MQINKINTCSLYPAGEHWKQMCAMWISCLCSRACYQPRVKKRELCHPEGNKPGARLGHCQGPTYPTSTEQEKSHPFLLAQTALFAGWAALRTTPLEVWHWLYLPEEIIDLSSSVFNNPHSSPLSPSLLFHSLCCSVIGEATGHIFL